jgi:hypothetical protein
LQYSGADPEEKLNAAFIITTPLWVWTSGNISARWHFLSVEGAVKDEIAAHAAMMRLELGMVRKRGWGSVRVAAGIGDTHWQTSIFPDSAGERYLLPVKADVRKALDVYAGDIVTVSLTLI